MKKIFTILATAAALLAASALLAPVCASAAAKELKTVVFATHLHCDNCAKKVTENISYVKGVKDLKVSLEKQEIKVVYDAAKTDAAKLSAEIRKLGYPAREIAEDKGPVAELPVQKPVKK